MYTSTRQDPSGIRAGTLDALRVQLLKMSPQQLQAFAMANQDDAIKLGLAAEADKVHKKHAQEYMALQMGQQPKPPVAQQILQSIGQTPPPPQGMPPQGMPPQGMPPQAQGPMPPQGMADGGYLLPEDQGIATLPVGDMDFAEGGIVAFGDGGEVPGYADGVFTGNTVPSGAIIIGNMYKDPVTGEMKYLPGAEPERTGYEGMSLTDIGKKLKESIQRKIDTPSQYVTPAELRRKEIEKSNEAAAKQNALTSQAYVPRRSDEQQFVSDVAKRNNLLDPTATSVNTPTGIQTVAPPRADTRAVVSPAQKPAGIPAIAPTKFERTTLPDITVAGQLAEYDRAMPKEIVDPVAKERQEFNDARTQAAARQVSLFEQEVQKRQPAFEERLRKLDEKEARVNTMADRNLNMALIEAGLAMMSGESPHAFVNIGKGAQVGMKSYAEGQAKIEAAKDKIEDARARIEEFRRNEDMMTAKERRALIRDYENTFVAAKELMFQGAKEAYGLKREDVRSAIAAKHANDLAQAQLTSRENLGIASLQSSENIAKAQMQNQLNIAQLPGATERILSSDPLFNRQLQLTTAATGMRGETAIRETWAKSPYLQAQYPNVEDYVRMMSGSSGGAGGDAFKVIGSRPAP